MSNSFLFACTDQKVLSSVLWKLMTSYLVLGVVSFGCIFLLLDRIGARSDPDKSPKQ
ncbi:Unc-93-like protein A, partial [Biomphalaria glabrata]